MKIFMKLFKKIFDKKYKLFNCYWSDLKKSFPREKYSKYNGKIFPEKIDLSESNIYGYSIRIMLTEESYLIFRIIIQNYYKIDILNEKQFVKAGIALAVTNEFRGIVVNLITNNNDLLIEIDKSNLYTPPPWIVYPNEDPRYLGSLQGEIDYWFYFIWHPFWNSLSLEEKKNYFRKTKPNRYWANYLMESPIYKEKL